MTQAHEGYADIVICFTIRIFTGEILTWAAGMEGLLRIQGVQSQPHEHKED